MQKWQCASESVMATTRKKMSLSHWVYSSVVESS